MRKKKQFKNLPEKLVHKKTKTNKRVYKKKELISNKNKQSIKNKPVDYIFLTTILILLAIGLVMVFSSSSPTAFANKTTNHDSFYYLKKQFVWAIIGLLSMFSVSNYNYKNIGKKSILFVFVSLVLLVMVTIIGTEVNGAKRWLGFTSSFGFQPSEFAKIAILIFFSYSLSKNKDNLKYFWKGLVPYLVIVGIFAALLLLEPHFSCTLLIASTAISVLYIAGARVSHFLILSAPILIGISGIIIFSPYRRDRLFAFLDPFSDPLGKGYQIIQSLYAIGSGGIFGLGLGQSRQKYLYLPEPQNDFIFSILCEELGLVGSTLVIFLFIILIWRGFRIASKTPDLFGSLLACGITTLIAIQTFTNIAVVTSSIPATGMPLPFFSYGGTALVFTLSSMGIILNISRNIKNV